MHEATANAKPASAQALEYLAFTLGQEEYGIGMRIKFNLGTPGYDPLMLSADMGLMEKLAA